MEKKINAAILCGGFGTRIKQVENKISKCLIKINNKPFILYVIDELFRNNVSKIILCTGHLGGEYKKLKDERCNLEIEISHEDVPLGTGGAILNLNLDFFNDNLLVLNGDSLCKFDLVSMYQNHVENSADISIIVIKNKDRTDAGNINIDSVGIITNFIEKKEANLNGYINAGVYLIRKDILSKEDFTKQKKISLEEELIPKWIKSHKVISYIVDGPLVDIGTADRLKEAKLNLSDMTK